MRRKGIVCNLAYFSLSLFLVICTVINTIHNQSWLQYTEKLQLPSILGMGLVFIIAFSVIEHGREIQIPYIFFALLTGCIQLFLIYQLVSEVGWDSGAVIHAALGWDSVEESNAYLSVYPNNLFLVFFYRIIFRIFKVSSIMQAYQLTALINLLGIQISMYYLYRALCLLFSKKEVYLGMFFFVMLFVFSPWIVIPYSDVVSMPFNSFLCYQYLCIGAGKTAGIYERKSRSIFLGMITFIGMCIKPTVLIVSIAGWAYLWIKTEKGKLTHFLECCLIFSLTILLLDGGWNNYTNRQTYFDINQEQRMTYTHYLMLGLNNNRGVYTQEDCEISQNEQSVKSREAKNWKEIKNRLVQKGFIGYLRHIWDKSCMIHSEGNFFWGGEGGMYFLNFDLSKHSRIRNIYYINGANYSIYKYCAQGVWFVILLVCGFGVLSFEQTRVEERWMISLSIWGIILFNVLFEARSRYLIPFLTFYVIMFCYGIQVIRTKKENFLKRIRMNRENNR